MVKGKVTIDLHNHRSGFTERFEQENMVTNAVYDILKYTSCTQPYNYSGYSDYLLPLYSKLLGGLILFDNDLEESPSNVYLPSDAHIVGYANQSVNTSNINFGSYNRLESKQTDTGFTTVWDFSTSQCNGVIKSLSRTYNFMDSPIRRWICSLGDLKTASTNVTEYGYLSQGYMAVFDQKRQEFHGIFRNGNDLEHRIIYYPVDKLKVCDTSNTIRNVSTQKLFTYERDDSRKLNSTSIEDIMYYNFYYPSFGYDGYIYYAYTYKTSDKKYFCKYFRIRIKDDYSFELDETPKKFELDYTPYSYYVDSTTSINYIQYARQGVTICKGKIFIKGHDMKFRIHDLTNPEAYIESDSDYPSSRYDLLSYPSGCVWIAVASDKSSPSSRTDLPAILYPDGKVVYDTKAIEVSGGNYIQLVRSPIPGLFSLSFGNSEPGSSDYYYGLKLPQSYLGTICNLTSAVTKTTETSMKVTYTLTDVQ